MPFYLALDHRRKYRFFSGEPLHQIQIEFSRLKKIWEKAKNKLMLLPHRILVQEQAFQRVPKPEKEILIIHSGLLDEKKIKMKLSFFLQKERSKHILMLAGETLLLPISGLMALLPGPNIFFGILALLMYTQWHALRGINRLLKKEIRVSPSLSINAWEKALDTQKEENFPRILEQIALDHNLPDIHKILWK